MLSNRNSILQRSIVASHCARVCEELRMDTSHIIDDFVGRADRYDEILSKIEWYVNFHSQPKKDISGNDITIVSVILKKLSVLNPDEKPSLRESILDYMTGHDKTKAKELSEQNQPIIAFFEDIGILSTLRYIMVISLLTGGFLLAQLPLRELTILLKNANLGWNDFLGSAIPLTCYEIAIQKDDPRILLDALDENENFKFHDLEKSDVINKNILSSSLQYNKLNIIQLFNLNYALKKHIFRLTQGSSKKLLRGSDLERP